MERTYLCIDLKSFYASVECVDRGLDSLTTNLVVADPTRTEKTICLAVSPAMKALGVPGRCRVFQIPKGIDYIMARPRMRRYMEVSADIYGIYLRYVSPEDIHVYSVDEVFMDATSYLPYYHMDGRTFASTLMEKVYEETGIRATAGLGPNLFLAKVALDVLAKHSPGFIGELDEKSFRERMWFHRPLTDIWNVGPGITRRLAARGVSDLAGVCALGRDTVRNEFGVIGDYLYDHAWGLEPATIADIRAFTPQAHSLGNGQVLARDYSAAEARTVLREMVDATVLELVEKHQVCAHISLSIGYSYDGPMDYVETDHGGRPSRRGPHGSLSCKLDRHTNSGRFLMERFLDLYDQAVDPKRSIRRLAIACGALLDEDMRTRSLLEDPEETAKEQRLQEALVSVRQRFGKNAMLKGTSLRPEATGIERNEQVGGHHA